jgi:hypothetical protein
MRFVWVKGHYDRILHAHLVYSVNGELSPMKWVSPVERRITTERAGIQAE